MNFLSKAAVAGMLCGFVMAAQPNVALAQQFTFQTERLAHPNIVVALQNLQQAMQMLQTASDNYGGNKANAMRDIGAAIHSLKKALYYRMNLDDAAIDRAP